MAARCLLLLPVVLLFARVETAAAETVRRKDGKVLEVSGVTFRGDRVEVVVARGAHAARIVLRVDQLDPDDVLPLWDRTHSPEDAAAVIASADLALGLGQYAEAANRYEVAFRLEPALRARRDAGHARIRAVEAAAALRDVEARVRAGADPRGAAVLARALLEDAALSDGQRRRVETLARLAEQLAAREDARAAAAAGDAPAPQEPDPEGPPAKPPAPVADAPPAAPAAPAQDAALAAIRHRLGAFAHRADLAREAAAAVTITNRQAIRHLQTAADAYLLARRLVREAPAVLAGALAEVGEDLRLALATTYLDLADLFRQEGRFEEARARVRAVLILDPGSEHAWELRRMIEDDLRNPPLPLEAPTRPAVEWFAWSPSPYYVGVPHFGYRGPCRGIRRHR